MTDIKDFAFGDKEPFEFDNNTYYIPKNLNKTIKLVYDPPEWTVKQGVVRKENGEIDCTIELVQLNYIQYIKVFRKVYDNPENNKVKLIIDCYNNWNELKSIMCDLGKEYAEEEKFQDCVIKSIYNNGLKLIEENKYATPG